MPYIGLYLFLSAYPEYSFVIDMVAVVMCKCIPDPSVSHVRMLVMTVAVPCILGKMENGSDIIKSMNWEFEWEKI